MDYFAFCFTGFLKTAAEIPRPLGKRLILLHFQPDCKLREVEIYYQPIFLKSLSKLLQQFLGFPHDLKTGQAPLPNPSAFLTLALVLHLNMQLSQVQ